MDIDALKKRNAEIKARRVATKKDKNDGTIDTEWEDGLEDLEERDKDETLPDPSNSLFHDRENVIEDLTGRKLPDVYKISLGRFLDEIAKKHPGSLAWYKLMRGLSVKVTPPEIIEQQMSYSEREIDFVNNLKDRGIDMASEEGLLALAEFQLKNAKVYKIRKNAIDLISSIKVARKFETKNRNENLSVNVEVKQERMKRVLDEAFQNWSKTAGLIEEDAECRTRQNQAALPNSITDPANP